MAARLTAFIVVAIVTVTVIAGLIVGAQRDDRERSRRSHRLQRQGLHGATATGTFAEAVAVRGNQILRVGSNARDQRLRRGADDRRSTRTAARCCPGFNDAHVHFVSGGLGLEQRRTCSTRRRSSRSRPTIRAFAEAHPDRPWVLGRGWYYEPFPGGLPTRAAARRARARSARLHGRATTATRRG